MRRSDSARARRVQGRGGAVKERGGARNGSAFTGQESARCRDAERDAPRGEGGGGVKTTRGGRFFFGERKRRRRGGTFSAAGRRRVRRDGTRTRI